MSFKLTNKLTNDVLCYVRHIYAMKNKILCLALIKNHFKF